MIINITSYGHAAGFTKNLHTDLKFFLKTYFKKLGYKVVLDQSVSSKYFNLLFEGVRYNYTHKVRNLYKKNIKIGFINTEFLIGEKNLSPKYYTYDNFFLLNRFINQKKNIFLLKFINFIYNFNNFVLFKVLNKKIHNLEKSYFFFKNPIKRILYELSKKNYFIAKIIVSSFGYFYFLLPHWKAAYMEYYKLVPNSKVIISLGLDNPYQKLISKKFKIPYVFIPGIYLENYFTTKLKIKKKYDFYFSGTINNYRETILKEIKKKKFKVFISNRKLSYKNRIKKMISSKYILDLRLNKFAVMLSFNRIISALNLGIPILVDGKSNTYPNYLDNFIIKRKILDEKFLKRLIINYKKNIKIFEKKRKKYIKFFSKKNLDKNKIIFKKILK